MTYTRYNSLSDPEIISVARHDCLVADFRELCLELAERLEDRGEAIANLGGSDIAPGVDSD